MLTHLIANRVPTDSRPSQEALASWPAWFERLGEHLADRDGPAFAATAAELTLVDRCRR